MRHLFTGKATLFLVVCWGCLALSMFPLRASARDTDKPVVKVGTLQGASWRIDIPAHWNHRLIVYFHGYSGVPVQYAQGEKLSLMFGSMLDQGYALIQSGYSQGGWALEQAASDTERVRQYFVAQYGAPKQTLVMGMSMGGALTAMTIENQPHVYAGALSLCGAIAPSDALMQRAFALRAAFDYYFPALLRPLVPVPADFQDNAATVKRIAAALAGKPAATKALLRWYGAADAQNLAPVIAAVTTIIGELQRRTHGNPVGNADLIYVGSGDDAALNDGVRRYRANPRAAAWLARWYTPGGRLLRPLLELHDTGDPLVPASSTADYALIAQRAGHAEHFVQQYVNREGHCVFTPQQVGQAFNELTRWVVTGKRPRAGTLP